MRTLVYLLLLISISQLPLNAKQKKINYSDKNMRWIIGRLNTELTFDQFDKHFRGSMKVNKEHYLAITQVYELEGQTYVYATKSNIYRVFVNKNNKALYASAEGNKTGGKEDKSIKTGLYDLPIHNFKKEGDPNKTDFESLNTPYVHYHEKGLLDVVLYWGDKVNQLLVRLNIHNGGPDEIEVMVNGWYENASVAPWRHGDNSVKQPMDFNQLLNIEDLQSPKRLMALRERIEKSWTEVKEEDIFTLDLSEESGICVEGCDDPNGDQKVFYGNLYYEGPMKNGLPHGKAHYIALWKNTPTKLEHLVKELPVDYKRFSSQRTTDLNFVEGKAQGIANFSQRPPLTITYTDGQASHVEGYYPKDMNLNVMSRPYTVIAINGSINQGKWTIETEFRLLEPETNTKAFYKGAINEAYEAHGNGMYLEHFIPKSEASKPSFNQQSELKATLETIWVNGQIPKGQSSTIKSKKWTITGIDLVPGLKKGIASGEKISMVKNKSPEYRGTGKMLADPYFPIGTWTLEKLNANTNEYEPLSLTDQYVVEKGYCMFKGTFDEEVIKVADINMFKRSEYISFEERQVLIAKQKQEREERERLAEIARKKREAEARQREYAEIANFKRLLREYTDYDVKIASQGWMSNAFKLGGETTGSAGIFIINTDKSSKTFTGTVSFSHPTKGDRTKDITLRVGGADSSGYGGAKTSFNLGFGSPYQIDLNLNDDTSGVYYFIYYFGLLIK